MPGYQKISDALKRKCGPKSRVKRRSRWNPIQSANSSGPPSPEEDLVPNAEIPQGLINEPEHGGAVEAMAVDFEEEEHGNQYVHFSQSSPSSSNSSFSGPVPDLPEFDHYEHVLEIETHNSPPPAVLGLQMILKRRRSPLSLSRRKNFTLPQNLLMTSCLRCCAVAV